MTASRLTTRPTPRLMLSSGLTGKEVGIASIAMIFRSGSWVKRPPGSIAGGSNGTRREFVLWVGNYGSNYTRRLGAIAEAAGSAQSRAHALGTAKTKEPADLLEFCRR